MFELPGYEIETRVWSGPSSEVYRATRKADGLPVVVKVSPPDSDLKDVLARFKREHEVRGTLQLDSVLKSLAFTRHNGRAVLVAEFFAGDSLRQHMDQGELTLEEGLRIAQQAAGALDEIHKVELVHADIGPESILYDRDSRVMKLANFGESTYLRNDSQRSLESKARRNTLQYISPEQTGRMNRKLDSRSDLYSLGATLYELFSGSPPFVSSDPAEIFHAHLASTPAPLCEVSPGIPPALSGIVMKLLSKSPEARYQTGAGLAEDLGECLRQLESTGSIESFELGRNDWHGRFKLPEGLYGREEETAALLETFGQVADGGVRSVVVSGPNGAGKTSLVNEVSVPLMRAHGYFASGRFQRLGQDVPISALAAALESLMQRLLTESEEQLAEWRREILEAVRDNAQIVIDVLPSLGHILGPQPAVPDLDAVEAQNRFNLTFVSFVQVFCKKEHPLVLFLDDMQWADLASLNLITHVLTAKDTEALLLISAYTEEDVTAEHSLMQALDKQREGGAEVRSVTLGALSAADVAALVADTLRTKSPDVEELSQVVWRKTGGQPFFVRKFLQTLHEKGLISFDSRAGRFVFDIEGVKAAEITDNVAELLVDTLKELPEASRAALGAAAAIGSRFDLETVVSVCGEEPQDVAAALNPALEKEFIAPQTALEQWDPEDPESPLIYKHFVFLHERVQQAAYSRIEQADRPALHLRIGRALRDREEDRLYEVVNQMNLAAALVDDPDERRALIDLNLTAAGRARASTAYDVAIRCLREAIELLGSDAWKDAYETVYRAHSELAECLTLSADYQAALDTIAAAAEHSNSSVDTTKLETLRVTVYSVMGELFKAVECSVAAARALAFMIPEDADELDRQLQAEIGVILQRISEQDIESFLDLPEMRDPEKTALMALLIHSIPSMFQTNANLFALVCCKMVTLSLDYGNCAVSAKGYGSLAVILSGVLGRYGDSYRFGKLGVDLTYRFDYVGGLSAAYFVWAMFASVWTQPIEESLELYEQCTRFGLLGGDHSHAAYGAARYTTHEAFTGKPVSEVRRRAEENLELLSRLDDRVNQAVLEPRIQFFKWLQSETDDARSLDGEAFDESAFYDDVRASGNQSMISHFAILRLMHRYLCGDFPAAHAFARESQEVLAGSTGMIVVAEHNFYDSLTLAALFGDADGERRAAYEAALAANQEQMKVWADSCPENFLQHYLLVEAERARIAGDVANAAELYSRATAAAEDRGFTNVEALACELAGDMWISQGDAVKAKGCFDRARSAYEMWGAARLVENVSRKQRDAARDAPEHAADKDGARGERGADSLDLAAVLKASNALAGEIILERLLEKLMNLILENAGADSGSLILKAGDQLVVQAYKHPGSSEPSVMTELPLADADCVSEGVVNYVTRTRELVVLDDAEQSKFQNDDYVRQGRPKSILCAPIVHQNQLVGVLYLENTLVSGAFTPDRVEALSILISQVAISIENAKLFAIQEEQTRELRRYRDDLEELVRERTRELESAQGRLLDMSRKAGMAEVAAGVLHNVGNVLNSVNVGTSIAMDEVKAMAIGGVAKLSELMGEHKEDLGRFLTHDPKGRRVPEYLEKLSERLQGEQAQIVNSLRSVGEHLEHMKNVIAAQQGYSRVAPTLMESCLIQSIFESALEISNAALANRNIEVIKEFEDLPPLPVDRHQVLQIIVNLISNAKHALAESPAEKRTIKLGLRMNGGDRVLMSVEDNGVGIKPEHVDRIFTHGFTTKPNGHGFGLHNCANAAQQMGGTIAMHSDGEGKGARFTLEIPVAQADDPDLASRAASTAC